MIENPRTRFFVDGSHYDRLRGVFEGSFDLQKLAVIANNGQTVDEAVYYRDLRNRDEAVRQQGLLKWLRHHGFNVKGREHADSEPRERYGTNLIELAVDVQSFMCKGDHCIILASDAKLIPLFSALRAKGTKVSLVSTLKAPDTIAPLPVLIKETDIFFDLASIIESLMIYPTRTDQKPL